MSVNHPIMTITRPSGAITPMVKDAFTHIFRREKIVPAMIEGESFHRYNRADMKKAMRNAAEQGNDNFSHFGPEANLLEELGQLFETYGKTGTGKRRHYLHNKADVDKFGFKDLKPGEFTPWEEIPEGTDLLIYDGLHGCVATENVNLTEYSDLRIGLVPIINQEWIQKIHRDTYQRGYSEEAVVDTILRRMHDYVHYVIPQFERTHINFQTVPVVDTSDPMIARDVPSLDESVVVIRFTNPECYDVDFPFLLSKIHNSWMSRRNSIVVPGGKLGVAIELIMTPIMRCMMDRKPSR